MALLSQIRRTNAVQFKSAISNGQAAGITLSLRVDRWRYAKLRAVVPSLRILTRF
jgi:hypothetical protein